jgi:AAA15 family ATPase/GTPase
MIVDFTVKNFRSIKEEQTLSLLASTSTKDKESERTIHSPNEPNIRLLRSALIYGANASGKTNLLRSLSAFTYFILISSDLKVDDRIPIYAPYRLDKNSQGEPSRFELEFISDDSIRYRYSVECTQVEVVFEELLFYPHKQEALLFSREKGKPTKFGTQLRGPKKSIDSSTLENQLFLSKAANNNHEQLRGIYSFLKNSIRFHTGANSSNQHPSSFTTTKLWKDNQDPKTFKNQIINLLLSSDLGISDLVLEVDPNIESKVTFPEFVPEEEKKQILEDLKARPMTYHKLYEGEEEIGNVRFELAEESDGTINMYEIAGKLIQILKNGWTLVVDELDSSMHTMLAAHIISLFEDPKINVNGAQLIAATHDVSLLDPELLKRDQIWFTEKNKFGATELYSLDDFDKNQVRNDTNFGRWYLDGRFGALPLITPRLFNVKEENEKTKDAEIQETEA